MFQQKEKSRSVLKKKNPKIKLKNSHSNKFKKRKKKIFKILSFWKKIQQTRLNKVVRN